MHIRYYTEIIQKNINFIITTKNNKCLFIIFLGWFWIYIYHIYAILFLDFEYITIYVHSDIHVMPDFNFCCAAF